MNEDKTFKKVTEGEGYISGDMECWCIRDYPFEEWKDHITFDDNDIYPDQFVPLEYADVLQRNEGIEPKVRYRVTFELEFIYEDDD